MVRAQEKTDWYYAEHQDEILGDARELFKKGDYSRALDLCNLHRDLLGDENPDAEKVDALVDLVLRCQKLATDLENYIDDGYMQAAKAVAEELKALNPYDERLRQFGFAAPKDSGDKSGTVSKKKPDEAVVPVVPKGRDIKEYDDEEDDDSGLGGKYSGAGMAFDDDDDLPKFVIKLSGGIVGMGRENGPAALQYGAALGLYDMGESPIGAELRFDFGPVSYSSKQGIGTTSFWGLDACGVVRAFKGFYPYVGLGYFRCAVTEDKTGSAGGATNGMRVPFGVTILIAKHFAIDLGACVYPSVSVWTEESVKVSSGALYPIKSQRDIFPAGLSPRISLGVAF